MKVRVREESHERRLQPRHVPGQALLERPECGGATPLLDSDWNKQAKMRERSERNRFRDAVGTVGAPRADGFALHVRQDGVLEVSSGRLYVGGVACELDASALLSELARDGLIPTPGATDLVYVNAWERDVSAIERARRGVCGDAGGEAASSR